MIDNIRLLDILGVEPNEEFKLRNTHKGNVLEGYFYFKKPFKLCTYYDNDDCEYPCNSGILGDIIMGKYEIVKISKLKKKLKDVTIEEFKKWKESGCAFYQGIDCSKCIFKSVVCAEDDNSWVNHKDLYSDKFLNQEIEVD